MKISEEKPQKQKEQQMQTPLGCGRLVVLKRQQGAQCGWSKEGDSMGTERYPETISGKEQRWPWQNSGFQSMCEGTPWEGFKQVNDKI